MNDENREIDNKFSRVYDSKAFLAAKGGDVAMWKVRISKIGVDGLIDRVGMRNEKRCGEKVR